MKKRLLNTLAAILLPTLAFNQSILDSTYNQSDTQYLDLGKVELKGGGQASNVNSVDLKLRPVQNSQEILTLVPGLFIAQHAGGGKSEQIFLRGFDVDHGTDFAINVDGIPVNMTSHAHGQGYADLHFLIPETVKALEVNKGPHNTQYGDLATAGSGEFTTKDKLDFNQVQLSYGSFGTKRVLGMFNLLGDKNLLPVKKDNFYIAASYKYTDAYFQESQNFNRLNLFSKYTSLLNNGDKLSFSASTFYSQWDASGQIPVRKIMDGTITRFGAIDATEGGSTSRTNLNFKYKKRIGSSLLTSQAYYSKYDFTLYSNFTFFLNDSVNGDQISQVDDRNLFGVNTKLKSFFKLGNKEATSTIGLGARYDNAQLQLNNTIKREFIRRKVYGELNQLNTWLYAEGNVQLTNKLKLNAGLRTDIYQFGFTDLLDESKSGTEVKTITNPKLNLEYAWSKKIVLNAKSGFGFHSNDARSVVLGRLENSLARAFGNEVSLNIKPLNKTILNIAAWTLDLENELVYIGDEGVVEVAGATRRYGLDFGLRQQIRRHLYMDLDINVNRGRLIEEPEGANRIPLAPTFTSIGGLTYKASNGISASLRYRYLGDRAANEDYSLTAEGFLLADAVVSYENKRFSLGVNAQNLLNVKWNEAQFATESRLLNEQNSVEEMHFTPGAPFSAMLNVAYKF